MFLEPYPVVPSFNDWQFPHENQPNWPPIPTTTTTDTCCITTTFHALQQVHIIPKDVTLWYITNGIERYSLTVAGINDTKNLIQMRSDIHYIFDDRWFVIIPKYDNYRVHCINDLAGEVDIHDILLQNLRPKTQPLLLARFAWAILLQVKPFITSGHARKVRIRQQGKSVWETLELSGRDLSAQYGGGGSKAATPASRKRRGDQSSDQDSWDMESFNRRVQNWNDETTIELQASVSDLVRKVYAAEEQDDDSEGLALI